MKVFELDGDILWVKLPAGRTQEELVREAEKEIDEMAEQLYGKNLKINGRITTGMSLMLGHKLAHICKTVSVFDPKEKRYIVCVQH